VFLGAIFSYALLNHFSARELVVERRGIETRAAELTARALAPGSPLGCLDAVANALVENGCEKPLFASPETVAAAVAYVDARFSLLAASATLAERDPGYRPAFERLRHGLETDHYGLVAHVLTTRGCGGADCAELKLLRDPARVVANMKARVFEAALGAHALTWAPGAAGTMASAPPAVAAPLVTTGTGHGVLGAAPAPAKFDFPSADSIPAVSIMNAEPSAPPAPEPRSTVLPPKRPAATRHHQPARQESARQAAAPALPPPLPAPPAQIAPPAAAPEEPPAAPPARPDPHTTR
jgi:hypothetical protein